MTATAFLIAAALLGHARASIVELSCSDNATCIENLAKEFVRSVRQQKTVRLFDTITVEPLGTRQARSNEGLLARILNNNAFSFDWNDYTFRIWKAQDRADALDVEVFESRNAKDVSEELPKKSKSKVEEDTEEKLDKKNVKAPKGVIRRRAKRKIMQAVVPMLVGMKSAAVVIFAMAVVTVLTLKAFIASKMALMVTVGMAIKKLYESYSLGLYSIDPTTGMPVSSPFGFGLTSSLFGSVGLQNHPYLYSQYPIDFPSASSHAYSVSGMSPQFQEMYNPTAMGTHQQSELLQNDASAQQSQQAPTVQLLNSTRATERWDGKSKLQKLLEPIVDGIRKYVDSITNIFYSMPATFRGLTSDVTTMKTVEQEDMKKPREILVPQPRNIAQRKMNYRKVPYRSRPKKYTELKVDLDKLKTNKDLYDYIKTKKYKYNYQHTYYYPRVKYFINPNTFVVRPANNRLVPYKKEILNASTLSPIRVNNTLPLAYWKPLVLVPILTNSSNVANVTKIVSNPSTNSDTQNTRVKRSLNAKLNSNKLDNIIDDMPNENNAFEIEISGRSFLHFLNKLSEADPITGIVSYASKYAKKAIKHSLKSAAPPKYYTITYEILMMTLDVIDGLVQVHESLSDYLLEDLGSGKKKKGHAKPQKQKKKKRKKRPHGSQNQNYNQNQNFQTLSQSQKPAGEQENEEEEEGTTKD